jgi:hypothetical protein
MSTSIIEKSRRKSVFGGKSRTTPSVVRHLGGALNQSEVAVQRQSRTAEISNSAGQNTNKQNED